MAHEIVPLQDPKNIDISICDQEVYLFEAVQVNLYAKFMFKDRLKLARERANLKQGEVAAAVGMAQPSYSHLESNGKGSALVVQLARTLGVNPEWLATGEGPMEYYGLAESSTGTYNINIKSHTATQEKVPLISWVQAGDWCDANDPYPPGEAEDWLTCPIPHSEKAYCLRVAGDSMEPEYKDGEIILVDPAIEARHNDDVIVRTEDGKATFKRLSETPDGTFLLALNPDWLPRRLILPSNSIICGTITASWRDRRRSK